ncbi:MAG TPA: carboxypeptidase regulatory-like domain-containing protein, partial [Gemmatimonadales bacterium]|nr:carboxypeptidase regulatory-like domain-containing protein [Gemmatimonadales bacterium]
MLGKWVTRLTFGAAVLLPGCSGEDPVDPGQTGSITGTISEATTPARIVGATVALGGKSTQTDADGHYDLAGVPAGAQLFTASKDRYVTHSGEVTVIAAETRVIDLRLVPVPGPPTEGPAGLTAESGSAAGQIHLTWSPITGAASYTLYWSTTPGVTPASGTPIPGLQGPSYDHSGLTPGTAYYYVLTAVSEGSEGPSSAEVSATGANGITLKILDPGGGIVADTSIQATVVVNSIYQLASVTATVEDRTVPLGFLTVPDRWRGIVLLNGLPSPRQRSVTFTATDIHGAVGKASQSFQHNRRAVVTVQSPVPGAVAQPQIRIRASCQDDVARGCAALEALILGFGDHIVGGINGIDQDVSLAMFDGQPVTITFQATDDLGRSSFASVTVYADQSTHLVKVDEVTEVGTVVDASADRLLVVDTISQRDVQIGSLKIQNRATGLAGTVLTRRFLSVPGAHLTPHGAVFAANEEQSNFSHLYEWRDNELIDLGPQVGVAIDEPYLAWGVFNGSLFRKDLQSGATITVPGVDGSALSDVGPNGDVVFRSADHEIRRFRDGVITTLVP